MFPQFTDNFLLNIFTKVSVVFLDQAPVIVMDPRQPAQVVETTPERPKV